VLGHIFFSLRDQDSIEAMLGGEISAKWARTKAPLWYEELKR
jgi:cytochrome b subunit of formate dehydrogenase